MRYDNAGSQMMILRSGDVDVQWMRAGKDARKRDVAIDSSSIFVITAAQ